MLELNINCFLLLLHIHLVYVCVYGVRDAGNNKHIHEIAVAQLILIVAAAVITAVRVLVVDVVVALLYLLPHQKSSRIRARGHNCAKSRRP